MKTHMKKLVLCFIVAPLSAWAEDPLPGEPYDVWVLVEHSQKELSELDPAATSDWSTLAVFSALFGPAGLAIGQPLAGIDTLADHTENEETADSIEAVSRNFGFRSSVLGVVETLDLDSDWLLFDITEGNFTGQTKFVARDIIVSTGVDYVMSVDAHYRLTAELDQLHVRYDLRLLSPPLRGSKKARDKILRSYVVVSESRGDVLRPFHEGEQQALIASIEKKYDDLLERYPQNESAYRKQRRQALKLVESRDEVLPSTAMIEGWPGSSLHDELRRTTNLMAELMRFDLKRLVEVEYDLGEKVSFEVVEPSGRTDMKNGYAVHRLGSHVVFRDKYGHLYALPGG